MQELVLPLPGICSMATKATLSTCLEKTEQVLLLQVLMRLNLKRHMALAHGHLTDK